MVNFTNTCIDTVSIKKRPKIIDTKRGQKQGRRGICHTGISSVSIIAIDTRVGRQNFVSIKNYQYKVCIDKNFIDTGARTQTLRPRIGNYQYKFLLGVSLGPIRVHARNQQKSCILALFLSKIAVFKKGLFFDHILWKFCYEIYFAAKNLILIQKTDRSEVNKNRIS